MFGTGRLDRAVASVIAASYMICVLPCIVAAQTTCPTGSRPATAADVSTMQAAGIPAVAVGMCWNPNDANTGTAAGGAKLFLQQYSTKGANISCLNTQFAEQLQKMIQAVPSDLGKVLIDSAYRDPSTQAALVASGASKVGACGTYHNYGLAADFNFSSKQVVQWIRANASQYGLTVIGNPTSGCFSSGFCDPAHVQESGSLPPRDQCGICSSNVTGTQSVPVTTGAPAGTYFPGAATTPGTNAENLLYTPPPGTQAPPGYCLMSASPVVYAPCSASMPTPQTAPPLQQLPLSYAATTPPAPAVATQPITQTALQTPQVAPTSIIPALTQTPATNALTQLLTAPSSTSDFLSQYLGAQPVSSTSSTAPSPLSLLEAFANPTFASSTSATSAVPIAPSTTTPSALNPGSTSTQFVATTTIRTIIPGATTTQATTDSMVSATGTFAQNPGTFSSSSTLLGLFDTLRIALFNLLGYLAPLSSPASY